MTRVTDGTPRPLGASLTDSGVNFAVYTASATSVELCLFDSAEGHAPERRFLMKGRSDNVWHLHVQELGPGQCYGFRADGPHQSAAGQRHSHAKLLIDPHARMLSGPTRWHTLQDDASSEGQADRDLADSAPVGLRSVVCDERFDWGDDRRPQIPWSDTILYECHVKGMTQSHPSVPESIRGSYLGLCSEPLIEHFKSLGVTSLCLLPVHESYTNRRLTKAGLVNYWGYSTLAFFAPTMRFASVPGRQRVELKELVRGLHRAGIEVIIDVVYNHTAEGDERGSTLSLRGLDNASYYWLRNDDRSRYENFTGCGNTLDLRKAACLDLVLESLRHWASVMHVDGFRFDLAPSLSRNEHVFDPMSPFLTRLQDDPVLSRLKLIAEPWDLGPGGYCLGRFGGEFREWNDRYRDDVRRYFLVGGPRGELATRLAGSSDYFDHDSRSATAGVNFVTCHDGMTLRDAVSFIDKHNQDNAENNRDGRNDELSTNFGVEGQTDDARTLELRERTARSLLLTLLCSQGVVMLSHGDELGRTQGGNNNAYCQDNETSWLQWNDVRSTAAIMPFLREALRLRKLHPILHCSRFLHGQRRGPAEPPDLQWIRPDGRPMTHDDWHDHQERRLGMLLRPTGDLVGPPTVDGLLLIFNGAGLELGFAMPSMGSAGHWDVILDAAQGEPRRRLIEDGCIDVPPHCALLAEHIEA